MSRVRCDFRSARDSPHRRDGARGACAALSYGELPISRIHRTVVDLYGCCVVSGYEWDANMKRSTARFDLTGLRFGALVAVCRDPSNRCNWVVRCDCGSTASKRTAALRSAHVKGCGRSCPVYLLNLGNRSATHGATHTPAYESWSAMIQRCTNPNRPSYKKYGAIGVTVCARWLESFEAFHEDMGDRPTGTTLDRFPDPNGNYEPGNTRWATSTEQARNRRNTKFKPHEPDQIRHLASLGYGMREIGRRFGVSGELIGQIVAGKIWS